MSILIEIYDILEQCIIFKKLSSSDNYDIKMEIKDDSIKIFAKKYGNTLWRDWYQFIFKDNIIYMFNINNDNDMKFKNIKELRNFVFSDNNETKFLNDYNRDYSFHYYYDHFDNYD